MGEARAVDIHLTEAEVTDWRTRTDDEFMDEIRRLRIKVRAAMRAKRKDQRATRARLIDPNGTVWLSTVRLAPPDNKLDAYLVAYDARDDEI